MIVCTTAASTYKSEALARSATKASPNSCPQVCAVSRNTTLKASLSWQERKDKSFGVLPYCHPQVYQGSG